MLSIYSEVIISEWKMFVQEGKALRSAVKSHPHAVGSIGLFCLAAENWEEESARTSWLSRNHPSTLAHLPGPWVQALVCHRGTGSEVRSDDSLLEQGAFTRRPQRTLPSL